MGSKDKYVIGIDFGTDSVRALLVDAKTGREAASAVSYYKRWAQGFYCKPELYQFRQHPLDYIEGMEAVAAEIIAKAGEAVKDQIAAISIDATGSTPAPVNKTGMPLALLLGFEEDPDAMFILWKDHTALQEADDINALAKKWKTDYTKFSGGLYSSEWFWAKILHIIKKNKAVSQKAYSWLEHCDWMPALLTGCSSVQEIKRSRCAAGHKAMWHPEFNGLPDEEFLSSLHPDLGRLRKRLYEETYTCSKSAGTLSPEWQGVWVYRKG